MMLWTLLGAVWLHIRRIFHSLTQSAKTMTSPCKSSPSVGSCAVAASTSPELRPPAHPAATTLLPGCLDCAATLPCATEASSGQLVDILRLPSKWCLPRLRSPTKWLADLRYTLHRLTHTYEYPDIAKEVLSSPRVTAGVAKSLEEAGLTVGSEAAAKREKALRSTAEGYVNGMAASISSFVLRTVAYVLLKVFRAFMSGILISEEQVAMLRQVAHDAEKSKTPIIYLPLHRSHLDYILLTYILWHYDLRVPHVASGDNLNFACFGWLLRGLGAFFIRRRLDKGVEEGTSCGTTTCGCPTWRRGTTSTSPASAGSSAASAPSSSAADSTRASRRVRPVALRPAGAPRGVGGQPQLRLLRLAPPRPRRLLHPPPTRQGRRGGYVLWHYDLRVPHVASGDNLNFACFGWLLRGLGAFFIRRRLDKGVEEGKRDDVYRAVLHAYMESLLREGQPIEFFMEGTRSRLGKSLQPKAGLLSIIVETLQQGQIDDAVLVPVSYSYEKVLDQGFVEELLGREKKAESLWGVWASMWAALGRRYGAVRVDFGAPTSLKGLANSLQDRLAKDEVEPITMPGNGLSGSGASSNSLSSATPLGQSKPSAVAIASAPVGSLDAERRLLVHAVAHHCLQEATSNAAVTGTQLLATLFATKFREGAYLRELVLDFAWAAGEARLRGVSLVGGLGTGALPLPEDQDYPLPGLAGCDEERALEGVREALVLLGPEVVATEAAWDDRLSSGGASDLDSGIGSTAGEMLGYDVANVFVRVQATPLANCLLQYYKNGAMHAFALDGLLATAFLASESGGVADYAVVVERACELGRVLANQFLFTKPCQTLKQVVEERLASRLAHPQARVLQRRLGSLEPEDRPRLHSLEQRRRPNSNSEPKSSSSSPSEWLEGEGTSEWESFASSAPLRTSPHVDSGAFASSLGPLPPIWEEDDGDSAEKELSVPLDALWVSELDEFYAARVLRFYQGLLPPYLDKAGLGLRPEWL